MHTPTDPYNSADADNPEETVLDPIEEGQAENTAAQPAYGQADELAWEKAFTGESAASTGAAEEASESADFHNLPPEVRSNATLHDVISAHSAEDSAFPPAPPFLAAEEAPAAEPAVAEAPADPELESPAPTSSELEFSDSLAAGESTPAAEADSAQAEEVENHEHWAADPGDVAGTPAPYVPDAPPSRFSAHIAVFFATLVLIPIAWYLISDAGVRLNLVPDNPWDTGHINFAALLELAGGMIALAMIALMARLSSLGGQVWGIVLTLLGLAAVIVPGQAAALIERLDKAIGGYNPFTGNVVHHLGLDLGSGRIAIFGFLLFIFALAIHGARKRSAARQEILLRHELALPQYEQNHKSAPTEPATATPAAE
ncbi:hypothetical protein [uncultured Arcanobacterium sp.]|uniref:hypothetical protein n=1 Tax=uncultured Arcanobacterium sp. TaxID=487520 RepID=UPI00262CE8A2|nr:hypothetical protein [uncultured Arcanobacterium sp.]